MKAHDKWMMISKMNALFFVIAASFLSLIGFLIADNRFELDQGIYIMILSFWLLAGINLMGHAYVNRSKKRHLIIPIWIKLILGSMMIGIIFISIYHPTAPTIDMLHQYQQVTDEEKK